MGTVRRITASQFGDYLATALQQAAPASQHGLPGKQQAASFVQLDFASRQHDLPTEQQPPEPFWQQSTPPTGQTVAPGGQHPQHPDEAMACDRIPKPIRPNTPAQTNVITDRRFMIISRN